MKKVAVFLLPLLLVALSAHAADVDVVHALSSVGCQVHEASLCDLVADAVREASGAPISLLPAGTFREMNLRAGTTKSEEILKSVLYPDDQIVLMSITGRQLTRALERSVRINPQKNLGFLQVSGVAFSFDPNGPKNARVKSVQVGDQPLKEDQAYLVATTESLADGAQGYFSVWEKVKPSSTGQTIARTLTWFLAKHDKLDYSGNDRITIAGH